VLSQAPEMYAGIITAGVMGYGVNAGFLLAENRVLHWTQRKEPEHAIAQASS